MKIRFVQERETKGYTVFREHPELGEAPVTTGSLYMAKTALKTEFGDEKPSYVIFEVTEVG